MKYLNRITAMKYRLFEVNNSNLYQDLYVNKYCIPKSRITRCTENLRKNKRNMYS